MTKRTKKYRPRQAGDVLLKTQPWRLKAMFDPLESIVRQLEQDGTMDIAGNGTPIFQDHNDREHWYETHVALIGVCEAFELSSERTGRPLDMTSLRQLANKMQYHMPIFEADTRACWACFAEMRRECMGMTVSYAQDLIQVIRIREELKRVAI